MVKSSFGRDSNNFMPRWAVIDLESVDE